MDTFLSSIIGFAGLKARYDDDTIDRLSHRYTASLLLIFGVIVTATQYVGSPIHCWCPAQFHSSHKEYTASICWVKNTYYVPWDEHIPKNRPQETMVNYYQWLPFILISQALMFYVPCMVWRFLCRRSGLNVFNIMDAAMASQRTTYADVREKSVRFIVGLIEKYILARRANERKYRMKFKDVIARVYTFITGKYLGDFLIMSYMLIKLVYVVNAIGQLYMLDLFMGTDFHFYGIDVIKRLVHGDDWSASVRFPRVTICDFKNRWQGQQHNYKVQCVLPINLFNEKIFLFIWFWLVIVGALTVFSFLDWLCKAFPWPNNKSFISITLKSVPAPKEGDDKPEPNSEYITQFARHYLKRDGVFLIRLLDHNMGTIAASDILFGLWEKFHDEMTNEKEKREEAMKQPGVAGLRAMDGATLLKRLRELDDV